MADRKVNVPGRRHEHLTVIGDGRSIDSCGRTKLLVQCDCGNIFETTTGNLLRTKMCKQCSAKIVGEKNKTHGLEGTRIYITWSNMKKRCDNPKETGYENYGGRGIRYCDEWKKFEPFYDWAISHGYSDSLTLDRIDVNGNYEPSNCRWITHKEQCNNKRNTWHITAFGKTLPCAEWARKYGVNKSTIKGRLIRGWDPERAVSEPVKNHGWRYNLTHGT